MGSAASKGARRLPKNTPTAVRAPPAVPRPPPEAAAASTPSQAQAQAPPARDLDYGRRDTALPMRPRVEDAPFSGEKDENIIKDAMDPQFMANLAKMGQVTVHDPAHTRQVASLQRTLTSRKKEYTDPSAIPPPGTASMQTLTELLDVFKTLPAGADPTPWYTQYSLKPEDMAVVRRWVNSPSIGEEETLHIKDGGNQTVEQTVEMKAIWVEAKDTGARSKH